jgi:hypothetical protein
VWLEVADSQGRVAFRASSGPGPLPRLSVTPGMHRIVWDLRYPMWNLNLIAGTAYDERPPRGVLAVPGQYTVKLRLGEEGGSWLTAPLTVVNDPRSTATPVALAAEFALGTRLMGMLGEVHATVRQIVDARLQTDSLHARLADGPDASRAVSAFERQADEILNVLFEPKAKTGVDLLNYPMQLNVRVAYLEDEVDFGDGAPTSQFREMAREYRTTLDAQLARWARLTTTDLPAMNDLLRARGLPGVVLRPGGTGGE